MEGNTGIVKLGNQPVCSMDAVYESGCRGILRMLLAGGAASANFLHPAKVQVYILHLLGLLWHMDRAAHIIACVTSWLNFYQ